MSQALQRDTAGLNQAEGCDSLAGLQADNNSWNGLPLQLLLPFSEGHQHKKGPAAKWQPQGVDCQWQKAMMGEKNACDAKSMLTEVIEAITSESDWYS